MSGTLIVIAKAPRAGHSKTRLCPPCTPEQAAALAQAALCDTLAAVLAARADRRLLALDGEPGAWLPDGFDVVAQRGDGLGERLAAAFEDAGGRAFLVGMDTPQVQPRQLEAGLSALDRADATLGRAPDGGYWGIGLRCPDQRVFDEVPMSVPGTADAQLSRLADLRLEVAALPVMRDVDTIADAVMVAERAPDTRFAAALAALGHHAARAAA